MPTRFIPCGGMTSTSQRNGGLQVGANPIFILMHTTRCVRRSRIADLLPGNQVTPFSLTVPGGETLYCWHILPLSAYTQYEDTLAKSSRAPLDQYTSSEAFKLLKDDPDARLILSCRLTPAATFAIMPMRLEKLTKTLPPSPRQCRPYCTKHARLSVPHAR